MSDALTDKIAKLKIDPTQAKMIADAVYGEGASSDYNTQKMIASSIINRMKSGRKGEFGKDLNEILNKGYYAVSNPNVPYKQANSGQFNDDLSRQKYAQAQQVTNDLLTGAMPTDNVMFYFTPEEETKLRRNPKQFNFNMVKPSGQRGMYNTYTY